MPKIILAADHAGFALKEDLKAYLSSSYEIDDCGAFQVTPEDDYPDIISIAAEKVSHERSLKAIIIGGSGQGEAIVANRYPHVRAAVWYGGNIDIVKLSREHNDANVLSLGARFMTSDEAKAAVALWLETPFEGEERHARRLAKIQ